MSQKSYITVALSILVTLVGTVAIYWQGLDGPFLIDDFTNIVNSYIADFDWEQIVYAATHNESSMVGRPVSVTSLLFSGILHGPGAWGYKYHNLLIHLINGLLIFWLFQKILFQIAKGENREKTVFVAGMLAAIWLLHPLMVSTVLYAVQRMAQLSTMFILTSLIIFVSLRENRQRGYLEFYSLAYILFPLSLALSIFSKENGALIPLYILAIELIVFQFKFPAQLDRKRLLVFEFLFVALPIIVGSLYTLTHLDTLTNYATRSFDMGERLLTQLHVVSLYLKMILLPRLSEMTLFHDYIEVTKSFDLKTFMLLILLIMAVCLIFLIRKKAPVLSFAIAWFLVSHLLESTIFSLELMFEHRNYLAAVGPLFAVVYYLGEIPDQPKLGYLNIIILLLMAFMTMARVQEWRSEEQIIAVAVTEHPDSPRAQVQMASLEYEAGKNRESIERLDIAQALLSEDFGPVMHQLSFLCGTGNDLSPWIDKAIPIARNYPATPYGLNILNTVITHIGNDRCPEVSLEMVLSVIEAAKEQPGNKAVNVFLSYLEDMEGNAHLLMGNYQKGMGLKLAAYERGGSVEILKNMVIILLDNKRLIEAEQMINYIEIINTESRGIETAMLIPLQERLAIAKSEVNQSE